MEFEIQKKITSHWLRGGCLGVLVYFGVLFLSGKYYFNIPLFIDFPLKILENLFGKGFLHEGVGFNFFPAIIILGSIVWGFLLGVLVSFFIWFFRSRNFAIRSQRLRVLIIVILVILSIFYLYIRKPSTHGYPTMDSYCRAVYSKGEPCPKKYCHIDCVGGEGSGFGCMAGCTERRW